MNFSFISLVMAFVKTVRTLYCGNKPEGWLCVTLIPVSLLCAWPSLSWHLCAEQQVAAVEWKSLLLTSLVPVAVCRGMWQPAMGLRLTGVSPGCSRLVQGK